MAQVEMAPVISAPKDPSRLKQELARNRKEGEKLLKSILIWGLLAPQAQELYNRLKEKNRQKSSHFKEARLAGQFSKDAETYLETTIIARDELVSNKISGLKETLGLPPFDQAQDRNVVSKVKEYAREVGAPIRKTLVIAKEQMDRAVRIQVERRKGKTRRGISQPISPGL
ncbi:hypothetical protein HYT33_01765 [Candidatus Roizmanbacteria bacterium]|nr:hypothetical protein [Candidatus Roizmanbacteria bacterium]